MQNLPIRTRTFLMVAVGVTIFLGIVGLLAARALQENTERVLAERLALAQLVAHHIDDHIADALAALERAAAADGFDLTDADVEPERGALRELYRTGLFSCHVFFTDARGIVLLTEPHLPEFVGTDRSTQPYISAALQTGKAQVSDHFVCPDSVPANVGFALPVKDRNGTVVGVVGGVTDPRSPSFAGIVRGLLAVEAGHMDVVDGNGIVLASTNPAFVAAPSHHHGIADLLRDGTAKLARDLFAEEGRPPEISLLAVAPLRRAPWGVLIAQPEAIALSPIIALRWQFIALGIVFVTLALLLTWITTEAVVMPIHQLLTAAHRVGTGDLSTPIAVAGRDEVAELARGFEAMRQKLAVWGEELKTAVQKRTRELSILAARLKIIGEIGRQISAILDLDELLHQIVATLVERFGYYYANILLVDAETGEIVLRASAGQTGGAFEGTRLKIGQQGITGWVAGTGQPLLVNDVTREPRYHFVEELKDTRSELAVPIVARGQVIGVMDVQSVVLNAFDEEDLFTLQALADQTAIAIENSRLYAREKQLAHYLHSLNQAMVRASIGLNVETVVQTVAQCLVEQCDAAFARVWLTDDPSTSAQGGEYLILRASAGLYTRLDGSRARVSIADDPRKLGIIARQRQPLITNQVQQEPYFDNEWAQREGLVSFAGYPILAEGRLLGVIALFSRQALAPEMLDVLGTFVNQVAIALTNARLYEAGQRRLSELSALFTVSSALREAKTLDQMLPIILRSTLEVLHCDQGVLSLVDKPRGEVVVRVTSPGQERLLGMRTRIGEGIAGRVVQTGRPMLPADFADRRAPETVRQVIGDQARAVLCYPLKTSVEVVGTLYLSAPLPREFSEDDLKILAAIADMAASAIQRATLFEQLEHRVHELSALFDVGKMLAASLHIKDVLDFIVGAAAEAIHSEASWLFLWDAREERLVMRAVRGFPSELVGQLKYRLGEGLSGWAFLESKTVNVPDVTADPRWKPEPEQEKTLPAGRITGVLAVPLIVGAKVLGVLGVANKIGAPAFTEGDESLLTTLAGQMSIALENARLYEDVRDLSVATIRALATAIDARDPYTRGHSEEVTRLAVQVARAMGWDGADLEMLEFAALLHDVGKIAVPDAILRKVEPLTPDEWNIIRLHPYHSAQIVKPVESLQRIVPWVYHHQEKWNGTGYPDGLKGEAIPLAARIIAVVDAFNAMTTDRPYRKAFSVAEAVLEIKRCAGTQFDPAIVEAFLRTMEK